MTEVSRRAVTIGLADIARDLDGILAVDAATFTNPTTRDAYEWEARNSDVARLWVARVDGAEIDVVAYCAGWLIFDELHINNMAVHPHWRRQGLARRLLTHVLRRRPKRMAPCGRRSRSERRTMQPGAFMSNSGSALRAHGPRITASRSKTR